MKKFFFISLISCNLFCADQKEKPGHERDASAAYLVSAAAASALSSPVIGLDALQELESNLSLTIIGPKKFFCCKGKVEKLDIQIKKPFFLYQIKHALTNQDYKDNFHKYMFKIKQDDEKFLDSAKSHDLSELFMIYVGEVDTPEQDKQLVHPPPDEEGYEVL